MHECEDVLEDSEGENEDDEQSEVCLEDQGQSDEPEELEEEDQGKVEPVEEFLVVFMGAQITKKKTTQ